MRTKGILKSWNEEKRFGFIRPSAGGKQVFVHINAFSKRTRHPGINQLVSYPTSIDKQGRPSAVKATLAGDRLVHKTERQDGSLPVIGATIFFTILSVFAITA
jgi:cold shock CspA family protein